VIIREISGQKLFAFSSSRLPSCLRAFAVALNFHQGDIMSRVGTLLRGMRIAKKQDLSTMANTLGTTPSRLQLVETGAAFPAAIERRNWASKLGFADLNDFDHQWRDGWARVTAAHCDGYVPIINKAPAGSPVDYEEYGIDSGVGFEYIPRTVGMEGELLFAVIVIGDSMSPVFVEGDLVIFRPIRQDDIIPDGSHVFVRFTAERKHTCTFKSVYRRADGKLELRPENPGYVTIIATGDEIERMALAIEKRPRFWCPAKETRRVRDEFVQEFPDEI
jgi:SOS-response transcriptional repressor LexA